MSASLPLPDASGASALSILAAFQTVADETATSATEQRRATGTGELKGQERRIDAPHLPELFRIAADRYRDRPAFAARVGMDTFEPVSYGRLYEIGLALATSLIELGVESKEHVALLADNRLEWIYSDFGILLAGAADVPRGSDVTPGDIRYILHHCDARVVMVENLALLEKVQKHREAYPRVERIILMDPAAAAPAGVLKLHDLIEKGKVLRAAGDRRVEERITHITPDAVATVIYTSGTTGTPKGVQLTHSNLTSQIRNIPFTIDADDRVLSILPVWHIYERIFELICISMGSCTYYTSIRSIADDLKYVKPTFMASAPRLWENLYLKILNKVKGAPPIRRVLFRAAYFSSRMFQGSRFFLTARQLDLTNRSASTSFVRGVGHGLRLALFALPYLVLNTLVLKKLRQVVGGKFKGTISGGGALPRHVDEFFNYIGIPVLEGYGMTETAPVLAVRTFRRLVIGTVGPVFPETEIRIVDLNTGEVLCPDPGRPHGGRGLRGEIHARGPQVMKGYYKMPEQTARVLRDGWMNTGDIGMMTFNDCLKILGRSKETIVLLSGENVEPNPIEGKLQESPAILQAMVVGQDEHHLGALIVPDVDHFQNLPDFAGLDLPGIIAHPRFKEIMTAEVKRQVSRDNGFKHFELIGGWRALAKPFEVGDELTSTFKYKRHVITEKYQAQVKDIFGKK